jgi:putative ABC transport system permease protein
LNTVSRGIRNAFRNSIRTFSIVLILGLSIGLSLSMLVARAAVANKITSVKSSIGNTITIAPAGVQGFQGGGDLLTTDQLSKVRNLAHVTALTEVLTDRLTTDNTNLRSAIEAGSFGRRSAGNSGIGFAGPRFGANDGESGATRTFTPPVMLTGVNNLASTQAFSGNTATYTSGQGFDATQDDNVAVVGKALAEKNNLAVGATFTAYSTTIKVVGIYDTGTTFTNAGVIMPLAAVQRLSSQANQVNTAVATIDSVDNLDSATSAIKSTLGSAADVTNAQETAQQAVEPLESVKTISTFSLIGAAVAGAVIILLTMVMIVRERRREIGVFKAIGASNVKVMFQFMSEAITLTVLGLVIGLIIGVVAANPVTKVLVNNSTSSASQTASPNSPPTFSNNNGGTERPRLALGGRGLRGFGNNSLANIRNVKTSVGLGIIGYGILTAFGIAIIGSAIPAFLISKVRPAEVMRAE